MFEIKSLTLRNIKVYLRDKTAVFFSFLSVIILLSLYILFIGNQFKPEVLTGILTEQELTFLMYSQLLPGLIVINSVSIPLGNLGNIINDLEYKQLDGFLVTPVKRFKVVISYYISSFLITVVISVLLVILASVLMMLTTGYIYDLDVFIYTVLYVILFSFISSAIMVFLTQFIKSVNAFGAFSGVFGSVVGFVSGIYMPLFILPDFIQKVASLVPFTHMTILLKQVMMKQSFEIIDQKFGSNIPPADYQNFLNQYQEAVGINDIGILGLNVPMFWVMLLIGIFSLGLLILSAMLINNRLKK